MTTTMQPTTIAGLAGANLGRQALIVVVGVIGLAALSQVAIGYPVPTTLQTFGVMLIGLTFGARMAAATLALYLLGGLAGAPFFAPFGGGTQGYLIGFFFGAAVLGYLADIGFTRGWVGTIIGLLVCEAIIFALGVTWLSYAFGMTAGDAIAAGLTPFLIVDGVKLILAALVGRGVLTYARAQNWL
jgi:biotin transport system substrate-specific component